MPTLKAVGRVIHYSEPGAGPAVLLVHSGGYTGTQWRGLVEALRSCYRLLSIDLQGCAGTTPWAEPPHMTLADEARLVRDLARACEAPVHLVGHSYGGAVALRAALEAPAPYASLVLMEPIPFNLLREAGEAALHKELLTELEAFVGTAQSGDPGRAMGRFVEYWNAKPGMWPGLPDPVRAELTGRVPAMLHQCMALKYDSTSLTDCARVGLPAVLMSGSKTIAPMQALSDLVAARIPRCHHVTLPGLRHMAPATHPQPVAEALGAVLATM